MKRTIDRRIEFMGRYYSPVSQDINDDPREFNTYCYLIQYDGINYTVFISEHNDRDLYVPVVKSGVITLTEFLSATNVAPPNYALGLGCKISEIDDEVTNLIVNYNRHTLLAFDGMEKLKDSITKNGGGSFLFSDFFGDVI